MEYRQTDQDAFAALLIGRRIVKAEMGSFDYEGREEMWERKAEGVLVLDDGTHLYLTGNDGGCSCSAGCYPLKRVATVDNVITGARVESKPTTDEDYYDENAAEGVYRIWVFVDNVEIPVAEFVGTDGNGYYGTGFSVYVTTARKELQ